MASAINIHSNQWLCKNCKPEKADPSIKKGTTAQCIAQTRELVMASLSKNRKYLCFISYKSLKQN
jgi:hypothetical protein